MKLQPKSKETEPTFDQDHIAALTFIETVTIMFLE